MIIGLDLDGVSALYSEGYIQSIIEQDNLHHLNADELAELFPPQLSYDYGNWPLITSREKFQEYHCNAVDAGLYRNLGYMPGVAEALRKLSAQGHKIHVITSRFVRGGQHARILTDTAYWLDQGNIPYDDIAFNDRDKTNHYADIYIDDAPKNIADFKAAGRRVLIFDTPYNQDCGDEDRVYNWDDIYNIISKLPV